MSQKTDIKKIPILMYHSISCIANPKFKQFAVSPTMFDEQMAYLSEHHYTPLTVTQLIQARTQRSGSLPERPVVITFDDGFADFLTHALPILQKYHFPATLYIATAFINGTSRWLQREGEGDRTMLSWEQVAEVNANAIECGAHTHTHPQLDTLPVFRAREEIETSKKILEDHLGQEVLSFAYPHGYFSQRVQNMVQAAGFRSACAVKYALSSVNDDPFALARLLAVDEMDGEAFAGLLAGDGARPATPAYALYANARKFGWRLVRQRSVRRAERLAGQRQEDLVP